MTDKKSQNKKVIPSSLRFPANNLETCLAKIRILFEKNSTNACSVPAMILDLGFSVNSGSADSLLASLKYYGFLEKVSSDKFKISEFILKYCISGELTSDIVYKALNSVPINKKIFSTYDFDNLPGDNELKNFLIISCFYSLKQAGVYLDTFRKNLTLYQHNLQNNEAVIKQVLQPSYDKSASLGLDLQEILDEKVKSLVRPQNAFPSTITYPLSSNQEILISLPKDIKETDLSDLEDIRDILELVLKKVNNQIDKKG